MPLAVIIKAGTSLALPLALASAGLVLFFLYASLPGARPHRQEGAAEQALRERRGRGINPMPPEGEGTGTAVQLAAVDSTRGSPRMASAASSPPPNASTAKPAPAQSTMSIAAGVASDMDVPAARLSISDPSPSHPPAVPGSVPEGKQLGISTTAALPPATPVLAPPSPTSSNDAERFVPVVFTHKDKGTAQRAFAELQRRYPKLMAHRQSELQLVNTGKNGIWYRLVVLPAGPQQEASDICGRLETAGYYRCWVKPY